MKKMNSSPHILLFPFMSKGHTIPMIHLSRHLLRRGAAVTLLTTPANRPFISASLSNTAAAIIDIPFPQNIGSGVPAGVESTDKLPDISVWFRFAAATKLMQPHFEKALESLQDITFMITDGFLGWTLDSANKYRIPRLVFYGMNCFAMALSRAARLGKLVSDGNEGLKIAEFPWIKLKREYFDPVFLDPEAKKLPWHDFVIEQVLATSRSYGILANTFYEIESAYVDYCKKELGLNVFCIGPLCGNVNLEPRRNHEKPVWIQWLDGMQEKGGKVLYVAFGSQSEMSEAQIGEIKLGLEKSMVNFLWVVRGNGFNDDDGDFGGRGIVVREWVDQREILEHESVDGFLSHCGWNSVMESVCAGVPMLCWPLTAEQPLNAVAVAEEIGVGLRVEMSGGFVSSGGLEKAVRELMGGEGGRRVRERAAEVGAAAVRAVEEGGSSWRTLNKLVNELHQIEC